MWTTCVANFTAVTSVFSYIHVCTPSVRNCCNTKLWQEGFAENGGGDLGVSVAHTQTDSLVAGLGVDMTHKLKDEWSQWILLGQARYRSDLTDTDQEHEVTVSNAILGSYSALGANRGSDGLDLSAGVFKQINDNTRLGFKLNHSNDSNGYENAVSAFIAKRW